MPDGQAVEATSTAVPAVVGRTWNLLPTFDGQTVVSITLGAALTIVTFWIGYRKTIGAQDERLRAASAELFSSVIKRVAVEREIMTSEQFAAIRQAKAYKAQVQVENLISFDNALDTALLEIIDDSFLDSVSKKAIIELIDSSRPKEISRILPMVYARIRDAERERMSTILGILSALLGLSVIIISKGLLGLGTNTVSHAQMFIEVTTATLAVGGTALSLIYYVQNTRRKTRDETRKS